MVAMEGASVNFLHHHHHHHHHTVLQDDSSAVKTHSLTATVGDKLVDVNHFVPVTCPSLKSEIKVS
jgi:hypothetical protein